MRSVPFSLVHVGVCFSLGTGLWDQMLCDPVAWSRRQGQVVDPLRCAREASRGQEFHFSSSLLPKTKQHSVPLRTHGRVLDLALELWSTVLGLSGLLV